MKILFYSLIFFNFNLKAMDYQLCQEYISEKSENVLSLNSKGQVIVKTDRKDIISRNKSKNPEIIKLTSGLEIKITKDKNRVSSFEVYSSSKQYSKNKKQHKTNYIESRIKDCKNKSKSVACKELKKNIEEEANHLVFESKGSKAIFSYDNGQCALEKVIATKKDSKKSAPIEDKIKSTKELCQFAHNFDEINLIPSNFLQYIQNKSGLVEGIYNYEALTSQYQSDNFKPSLYMDSIMSPGFVGYALYDLYISCKNAQKENASTNKYENICYNKSITPQKLESFLQAMYIYKNHCEEQINYYGFKPKSKADGFKDSFRPSKHPIER